MAIGNVEADSNVKVDSGQPKGDQQIPKQQQQQRQYHQQHQPMSELATLEMQYFKAVSFYRRRNYERCVEVCNVMLEMGNDQNVSIFSGVDGDLSVVEEATELGGQPARRRALNRDENERRRTELAQFKGRQEICGGECPLESSRFLGGRGMQASNVLVAGSRNTTVNWPRMNLHEPLHNHSSRANGKGRRDTVRGAATRDQPLTMPTWLMEAVWQLKMRALTQRVYVDDLETNEGDDDGKKNNKGGRQYQQ